MPNHDPIDDVAFLARSDHRVEVLWTLRSGPKPRPDIHEKTGIPQPTLGRVLGSFEDRHWIERRGQEYALTPGGELLAAEFGDLLDTVETIQRLGGVATRLPTEEMDFDLREFADATVTTPRDSDALHHVRRLEEVLYSADNLRNVSTSMPPGSLEDYQNRWEKFFEGDQQIEAIIPENLFRIIVDEGLGDMFHEALELTRIELYVYEGTVPALLAVADGTAVLAPTDEKGFPTALIETENETIRSWIDARLDEYRAQSTRVTPDDLAQ